MEQQGQVIRFTPTEIKELVASGEMTADDIKLLHKDDQLVAVQEIAKASTGVDPQALAQGFSGMGPKADGVAKVASGAAQALGPLAQAAGQFAKNNASAVGGVAGTVIGGLAHHPIWGGRLGSGLGKVAQKMMGGQTPPAAPKSPPAFSGTGAGTPASIPSTGFSRPSPAAQSASPAQSALVPSGAPPRTGYPKLTPPEKSGVDLLERAVNGGVQDDFARGGTRVNIRKPAEGAYSPNVSTESSWDDILEMILGTARTGQTPLKYHQSAPPNMRHSVDALKKQTSRRKPS